VCKLFVLWALFLKVSCGLPLASEMPCPFTRILSVARPAMQGNDVFILQNLLQRTFDFKPTYGSYDNLTSYFVHKFQEQVGLPSEGVFDVSTANIFLAKNLPDNYKDSGVIPSGYLYKMYIPVYANRSIETMGTLYWHNGTILHQFTVRTHGQNSNTTGLALNELCSDGSTPTGLSSFDLNSPEDDPVSYGPYPVNRAVQGMAGNAAVVISDIRDGILMHTGEWPNWNPSMPMPNSHGCVHGHPLDIKYVWDVLVSLGIQVRENTNGKLPYPYSPQGLLSIELIE